MLSSMAAEGTISARDAQTAMIERQGAAFEEARNRVNLELAFKTPGAAPAYATLHAWNKPEEWLPAWLYGWLPTGLLPEGELDQRGLGDVYSRARQEYNAGNPDALERFFDQYPEFETRLALWDAPEERLRQFMISDLWEMYSGLGSFEKQQVREQFGPMFQNFFLDNETRDYNELDVETLAYWTKLLGGTTPRTAETSALNDMPDVMMDRLQMAPPEDAAAVNAYRKNRNDLFPNWYAMSQWYFGSKPGAERKAFLQQFPELKEYFDWNRAYKAQHPVIEQYVAAEPSEEYDYSFIQDLTPSTSRQLLGHYYAGEALTSGVLAELRRIWVDNDYPGGGDFEHFIEEFLRLAIAP
jgi:hypothetical protein